MTAAVLDFCAARRGALVRELINEFASELAAKLEFIANASDTELDAYEKTLSPSPEARAFADFYLNGTTPD